MTPFLASDRGEGRVDQRLQESDERLALAQPRDLGLGRLLDLEDHVRLGVQVGGRDDLRAGFGVGRIRDGCAGTGAGLDEDLATRPLSACRALRVPGRRAVLRARFPWRRRPSWAPPVSDGSGWGSDARQGYPGRRAPMCSGLGCRPVAGLERRTGAPDRPRPRSGRPANHPPRQGPPKGSDPSLPPLTSSSGCATRTFSLWNQRHPRQHRRNRRTSLGASSAGKSETMIRLLHRTIIRRPNSKGQALVEFAFVFPLFMVLLVAVIEYGFLMNATLASSYATRDASLIAAEAGNAAGADCAILKKIEDDINGPSDPANITTVQIYWADPVTGAIKGGNVDTYTRSATPTLSCTVGGVSFNLDYGASPTLNYLYSSRCNVINGASCASATPALTRSASRSPTTTSGIPRSRACSASPAPVGRSSRPTRWRWSRSCEPVQADPGPFLRRSRAASAARAWSSSRSSSRSSCCSSWACSSSASCSPTT